MSDPPESARPEPRPPDAEPDSEEFLRPASNAEMRRLFAECVERQRSHSPQPVRTPSRPPRRHIGTGWTSLLKTVFLSALEIVRTYLELTLSFLGRVFVSRVVWASMMGLLMVLLIPKLIPKISASLVTQQDVYSQLNQTFTELKELRSKDVDISTWDEFQERSEENLAALVPQLERKAKSGDPASMSLLWIARDYLPVLLNDRNGSFNETEQKIETHLARIEAEFQKASHSSETWDVWTTSIIGLDVLGTCFALGYFGRNWWSRAVATH